MKYVKLNLVRGISAILVAASHLRAATVIDYDSGVAGSILEKVFYFVTGLGHQAVMVFFVLSGFFVGGAVLRAGRDFSWANYLAARFARLWVVLLPCLLLTYGIDRVIMVVAPEVLSGTFAEQWHSAPHAGNYDSSLTTAIGNVFFVQTIMVPTFGSNGPLWSLSNEFWYYILFPFMTIAFGGIGKSPSMSQRIICAFSASLVILFIPIAMLQGYVVWLLGLVVLAVEWTGGSRIDRYFNALWPIATAFLLIALILSKTGHNQRANSGVDDLLIGLAFASLCAVLVSRADAKRTRAWFDNLSNTLADFSFSLYLSHFPLVILIGALFYTEGRMRLSAISIAIYFGWLAFLLIFGWIIWWIFERHTAAVRRRFEVLFSMVMARNRGAA
ncbi:acyltransferase [Burkholderia sp. MSMB1589WGS]|uniref:acyltransferase family protein n=1 Tax=Burkholderia sp. MSMB1589WGS TaxID=1636425 RepID=UPI0009ECF11B|nr:acyltransferase [Burkholderia sp. MSMB1589WGS]